MAAARARASSEDTGWPSSCTLPLVGKRSASAAFSSVVLPAPLGPIRATKSLRSTRSVTESSSVRSRIFTLRFWNSSSAMRSMSRGRGREQPAEFLPQLLGKRHNARAVGERFFGFERGNAPILDGGERLHRFVVVHDLSSAGRV